MRKEIKIHMKRCSMNMCKLYSWKKHKDPVNQVYLACLQLSTDTGSMVTNPSRFDLTRSTHNDPFEYYVN